MEKKQNPNFVYWYSEILKQEIAMSKKTGDVTCADGVKYSRAEMEVMTSGGAQVGLAEHRIKKIFGGEIVGFERRSGTVSQGKPAAPAGAENSGNVKNPGVEMAGPSKNGSGNESGELDIF
jgi:hypothetical protein